MYGAFGEFPVYNPGLGESVNIPSLIEQLAPIVANVLRGGATQQYTPPPPPPEPKRMSPLVIGLIVLGGLIVVGGTVLVAMKINSKPKSTS